MKLTREAIQRMISQKQGTSNVTVINQEGGGGGGGVALGPLLTSLNAEAMPSAEGYLHWTGSAWAFDTPTGGDPVDLTPYALKTWVQTNYASMDDIADFITKDEADTYYAALSHTHANYLPLSAGANKALTGSLYFSGNSGINWAGGIGMLACTPESGWTGISSSQWGVGALSAQGVIRSNANDILHYRNGTNYKIWDAYNFTPSDYLPLTGGTVESLTVTNGLDADSITVESIVNSNTLAEYLDQDASDARYLQLTGGTLTGNLIMNGAGIGFGPSGNYGYIDYSNSQLRIGYGTVHVQSDGLFLFNGDQVATQPWVTARLGNYLPLTGGTVNGNLNVKGVIQAQDSSGNNKVIIYGTTGNIRAEKVYIGGSTSGYEAATHNWVTSQGYQANVIETVKVAGTALTPTNKAVNIPAATSDGSTFGVVAIGTGFTFDEGRLCVAEAPITMGFKRLNKSTSETWDANTMTVNGTQYALLTNYRDTSEWANMPSGMSWGGVLQITAGSGVGYLSGQLAWDSNHNVTTGVTRKLYWRSRNSTGWGTDDWHTIAFEDWVTDGFLPLSAGTDKKLTGNLFFNTVGRGIYLKNPTVSGQADSWFPAIYQNSSNLWIGAIASSATHHLGQTYISAGYDVALSKGNPTIYVSVPNASNNSALNYGVWHMGNLPTADVNAFIKGVSISNIPLSPVDRVVNIPMAETNVPGVIQLGTGLVENESHTEVDTTIIASRTWADGRYLPLTAGSSKPLTGDLWLNGNLVAGNQNNTTNDDSAKIAFYTNKNYPNISPYIQAIYENNYGRKRLSVFQKNVADWDTPQVEVFTIKPDGNVGIGTNAPDYKLDVSGVIRATEGMMVRNGSSDAIGIDTTGVFFNKAQEGGSPIPSSIFAFTWDSDAQNVIVSKNGNMTVTGKLAVGTTTFDGSNAKLQVGGNMFATGSITSKSNAGNVSLGNGNISATNLYISTVVFGSSNNDPAIYIGNGHVYARNSQGQTTMII